MSIPLTPARELPEEVALALLTDAELTVEGQLVEASNATLYCAASNGEVTAACVYKPSMGERPLWDFPDGTLSHRELAAYEISRYSGWAIVPPTVLRDGPFGPGMVQLWIEVDEEIELLTVLRDVHSLQLRRIALLDCVINNADRKGSHVLPTRSGHLYGVDHGVSFHVEPKLRTLLWHWAGEELTEPELAELELLTRGLASDLGDRLGELLSAAEIDATCRRVQELTATRRFPDPPQDRHAIPWPPI